MANEYLKHFLDQAGLGLVWEKIKGLVSAEEIRAKAEELRIEGLITAEEARAIAAEAKKVDKEIVTAAGKALIFNEADGGGAKFEAANGTASFAGVNSDTNGGIGAQLYDIEVATNKGAKLDVTKNGIFYTKGDTSALPAAQRDVSDNEIVVWADIKNIPGGMRFIGYGVEQAGETQEQTITRIYEAAGYAYPADRKAGDIVLINDGTVTTQYIYSNEGWKAIGDADIYATKVELAAEASERATADNTLQANITAEATARANADTALQANIDAEVARAKAEEAKKADLPGECPPWLNPTGETPYPWFMASLDVESTGKGPDAAGNLNVGVGAYNFNMKQYYKWDKSLPFAATASKAGLMVATDKEKLDGLIPMTDAEIEAICQ